MLQSSISGKKRIATPLEFDLVWDDPNLINVLDKFKGGVNPPSDHLCKPLTYSVLVDCIRDSVSLREQGLTDISLRLIHQLGSELTKTIYYGFLVGKHNDFQEMERPPSPETLVWEGKNIPATYLLMGHLIAQAVQENLRKVANISMRSVIRGKLRKFVLASGYQLRNYKEIPRQARQNPYGVIANRSYDYGGYVIFYVSPLKYEDMCLEIMPSTLIESKKAELEIRKLAVLIEHQKHTQVKCREPSMGLCSDITPQPNHGVV